MELEEAKKLGEQLLIDFNLKRWKICFDRGKRRLGICRHYIHLISLSKEFVQLNEIKKVKQVMLHEIAHALVGTGHGHDRVWKNMAITLGVRPSKYTINVISPKGKYAAVCNNCKKIYEKHRLPKNQQSCGECCSYYNSKYKLHYSRR